MSNEGTNGNAAARGSFQGVLKFFPVQPENQDVDILLGFLDRREKGLDAVVGLY